MATIPASTRLMATPAAVRPRGTSFTALATLAARRFSLSVRTPRELVVPLLTPVLFALVIAPALRDALGATHNGVDYMSFVALATVGLLIPLNTMFGGLAVIVDRLNGAQRELLAAPVRRSLMVLANLAVVVGVTALQVTVLIVLAAIRGAQFHVTASGLGWVIGTVLLFTIGMYGIAETVASRMKSQEEYIGAVPAIAIVPWFFAGSLFPIHVLPGFLDVFAKVLPLTHALAVVRYGLLGVQASGLHDIWGPGSAPQMATMSLGFVAAFAVFGVLLAVRAFTRSALR